MAFWLKLVYNRVRRDVAADWRDMAWISDHHRGSRSRPTRRPSYVVEDEIVLYSVDDRVSPARLRVTAEPRFDPDTVERLGFPGDAD